MSLSKILSSLLTLTALAVVVWLAFTPRLSAKQQRADKIYGCTVPSEWGEYRGAFQRPPYGGNGPWSASLTFQDAHGTLRFISEDDCVAGKPTVIFEVRRSK